MYPNLQSCSDPQPTASPYESQSQHIAAVILTSFQFGVWHLFPAHWVLVTSPTPPYTLNPRPSLIAFRHTAGHEAAVRWRGKLSHISPVWYQLRQDKEGALVLVGGHEAKQQQDWLERMKEPVEEDVSLRGGGCRIPGFWVAAF